MAQQTTADVAPGDRVNVKYTTAYRSRPASDEGTVVDELPYTHRRAKEGAVHVKVERENGTVYLRVEDGTVKALHHATRRHDTRQGSLDALEVQG